MVQIERAARDFVKGVRLGVAMVVVVISAGWAGAQGLSFGGGSRIVPSNTDRGIPLGPWLFSPGVEVAWYETDNLFREPDPTFSDSMLQVGARAQFDLNLSEQSNIQFVYNPLYRSLDKYQLQENWSHLARLKGSLVFPSGLKLVGNYDYTRSSLDVRDIDPSGELAFSASPYTRQQASLRADYWLSPLDAVSVDGDWNDLDYSGSDYFGSRQRRFGVGWVRSLGPLLESDLRVSRRINDGKAYGDNPGTESTSDEVTLQFNGELSPTLKSDLKIGWRQSDYDARETGQRSTYQGPIVSGGVDWDVSESVRVNVGVSRSDYLTAVEGSRFSVTTRIQAGISVRRGRVGGSLNGSFGRQEFNGVDLATGEKRTDDLMRGTLSLSYQLMSLVSARANFTYVGRKSDPLYTYNSNTVSIGIVSGF